MPQTSERLKEMKDEHARLAGVLITLGLNPTVLAVAYARCLTSRTFGPLSLGRHALPYF